MKKRILILSLLLVGICTMAMTANVTLAKYTVQKSGTPIELTINEHNTYTYAILENDPNTNTKTKLSVRNRKAVVVYDENNEPIELIDKDGTYALGDNGVIYALPYQRDPNNSYGQLDVRIAQGNVPAGAITNGWSTIHNNNSGTIEQTATSVTFDDTVYLQGNLCELFQAWPNLVSVDLQKADFSAVQNTYKMFDTCRALTSITFATGEQKVDVANVTNMSNMFYDCRALKTLDLSGFVTAAVTNMSNMFGAGTNAGRVMQLESITFGDGFDTSNVTNMSGMFYGCYKLTNLDLRVFDTANVINMSSMFLFCSDLTELNLSNFNTSKVTSMQDMFKECNDLTKLDVSKFNTSNVENFQAMFHNCTSLTALDVSNFKTGSATNISQMFYNCKVSTLNVSGFDTQNVNNMNQMFRNCSNVTELDVSNFNTGDVINMSNMFNGCSSLLSLDVSKWDTQNVTSMSDMFTNCSQLTTLNVGGWNANKVTGVGRMFWGCSNLETLNLSNFVTGKLTDFQRMFEGCGKLTELDLSGFDTEKITDVLNLFSGCSSLKTIYVSDKFVTDQWTRDDNLFNGCTNLTGGNGTTFTSTGGVKDKTYAHIDGVNGLPGYFTAKPHDDHGEVTYTDNEDGTHIVYCGVYGEPIGTEAHSYVDGKCVCGAEKASAVAVVTTPGALDYTQNVPSAPSASATPSAVDYVPNEEDLVSI